VVGVTTRPQLTHGVAQRMCAHGRADEFKPDYMSQALAGRSIGVVYGS
jgi:hypothetical protein